MALIEFVRARPMIAFALLGVSLGSGLGLSRSIAPAVSERAANDLAWQLPPISVVKRFDDKQFAAVRKSRLWGDMVTASGRAADGKPVLQWRLTGIILEPVPMALVLADGSLSVQRVGVGEDLPDGAELRAVTATGIDYMHDGCPMARQLYGDPMHKPEADCSTHAEDTEPDNVESAAY